MAKLSPSSLVLQGQPELIACLRRQRSNVPKRKRSEFSFPKGDMVRNIGVWIIATALSVTVQAQVNPTTRDALQHAVSFHVPTVAPMRSGHAALHYGWQTVGGFHLFYREGGPANAPTLVLLHGSPTPSPLNHTGGEHRAAPANLHVKP